MIKMQALARLFIVTQVRQHFWLTVREGQDRPRFLEAHGLLFCFVKDTSFPYKP